MTYRQFVLLGITVALACAFAFSEPRDSPNGPPAGFTVTPTGTAGMISPIATPTPAYPYRFYLPVITNSK